MAIDYNIISAVLAGVVLLLVMIMGLKLPAFLSLLVSSIVVGLLAGLDGTEVINTVKTGMGSTLGFVATVVGLGAMFGGILELTGGAKSIAQHLLRVIGKEGASWSMGMTGFLIAIPVFFDVAFIILVPVIYALQKKTQKSLLHFAIPLLSGLAITHSFIPPTPGPIAVAEIINANLGWVMLVGFLAGLPALYISGILFGKYIGDRIHLVAPLSDEPVNEINLPSFYKILAIIMMPIGLIILSTILSFDARENSSALVETFILLGHPFVALIIANIVAWYLLGRGEGYSSNELLDVCSKSFKPAGLIILLTGAGGVFKQMLVKTEAGAMMATGLADLGISVIFFAFISASLIRVVQGSATVAMITAAGLVSPLLVAGSLSDLQLAALVIAIASGASIFSHVNDSGFWLVKEYLGMTEKQTFRSWTLMTGLLAFTGFTVSLAVFYFS